MNENSSVRLNLVDGYWDVEVSLNRSVPGYGDNVSIRISERCPAATKQIRGDEIGIGTSAADARALARRLMEVAAQDEAAAREEREEAADEDEAEPALKSRRGGVRGRFTSKQGQYLAFIQRYISKYGRAPAESDIQRHFLVSAPTVNQMMQRLARLGLIARTPGQARSIRLLVAPESLPRS
ncbi:MAG: hypothetical protein Q7S40_34600 [Opitutaceae bacterium]|nr:hypothetical protein [Opitutaceae bacterium]